MNKRTNLRESNGTEMQGMIVNDLYTQGVRLQSKLLVEIKAMLDTVQDMSRSTGIVGLSPKNSAG